MTWQTTVSNSWRSFQVL